MKYRRTSSTITYPKSGIIIRGLIPQVNNMRTFSAYIEWDPEIKVYYGIVPSVQGAYSQADTLDELVINLKEVLELCLETVDIDIDVLPKFVGIQQIEVTV
jgi:predicted RNase H-like HicB family nuclease